MFKYHIWALLLGTILEVFLGKQYYIANPFNAITAWIKYLDRALLGDDLILLEPAKQKNFGMWLIVLVLFPVFAIVLFFMLLAYEISPVVGMIFEAIASYYCLEANYTYNMAREMVATFYGDGFSEFKKQAGIFCKCDTENLDMDEINERIVTKVANDAGDLCISPMLVMFLFGPVGGFIYKTIDAIDTVVGHKNKRYEFFGYYTAKLNQIVDSIPGRLSGYLAVFAARFTFGDFHWKNARYIHLRDRMKAISAFAGALELSLKNGATGDGDKEIEVNDINRAADLLRNMFFVCQFILVILLVFF